MGFHDCRAYSDRIHRAWGACIILPVGVAAGGVATWRLIVHGTDVPGRWIVVAGEFRPA